MSPTFALTPTSTGRVYCSTFQNFIEKNCRPTTPLPHNHPFWALWHDHLASLRSEDANPLLDALIAIEHGNPDWTERASSSARVRTARRTHMRDLLIQNPPNIVLLNDLPGAYGLHHRWEQTWQFICLNEDIINLWAFEAEQRFALAAVVRAMIDHELGHWVQTLVSGRFSNDDVSKRIDVSWTREADAGNFVEVYSRGGIVGYDTDRKKAYIITGPGKHDIEYLSHSYLRQYRQYKVYPSKFISKNQQSSKMKIQELFPNADVDDGVLEVFDVPDDGVSEVSDDGAFEVQKCILIK